MKEEHFLERRRLVGVHNKFLKRSTESVSGKSILFTVLLNIRRASVEKWLWKILLLHSLLMIFLRRPSFYNSSRTLFRIFDWTNIWYVAIVLVSIFHKIIATTEIVFSFEMKSYPYMHRFHRDENLSLYAPPSVICLSSSCAISLKNFIVIKTRHLKGSTYCESNFKHVVQQITLFGKDYKP